MTIGDILYCEDKSGNKEHRFWRVEFLNIGIEEESQVGLRSLNPKYLTREEREEYGVFYVSMESTKHLSLLEGTNENNILLEALEGCTR